MRHPLPRTAHLFVGIALLTACGGGDSAGGPDAVPTSIEIVSAAAVGPAGVAVAQAPTFAVKDQTGANMANVPVSIAVTAGGGSITGAPTHTAAGPTPVGVWTMGPTVGANVLTITVEGLAPKALTITTVAGPPATIVPVAGNGQLQFAGRAVADPIRFAVRDAFGNPVAGQSLFFAAVGGGTVSSATAPLSGPDGLVQASSWVLGKRALPQQLRASLGTLQGNATATVRTSYDIDVRFFGTTMSAAMEEAFIRAAARISAMVVGDLPGVNVNGLDAADYCGEPSLPTMTGIADDVVIYAGLQNIDGPNNVLAQAGPCAIRDDASSLPVLGIMMFDNADAAALVASGNMEEVITHEMMHVLGFGDSYWSYLGYLTGAGTNNPVYSGGNALADCRLVGGASICASTVPIHNVDGPGSADSHWRESVFRNELMTAGLNSGSNPISRMTIGGFMDLGYSVNYDAADTYRIPGTIAPSGDASLSVNAAPPITGAGWEQRQRARVRISANGRVRPVIDAP